jgi:uncharacterized membrane protein
MARTEDDVSAFFESARGICAGAGGSAIGGCGGGKVRAHMAKVFGRDPPAELIGRVRAIVLGLVSILAP